jgi:hypothetical protein
MELFKKYIIESSVEIKTTPDKIWDFFYNLENNYKEWYPEEHHFFHWTKGEPLEIDSKFDSLEIVDGHKTRLKGKCIEALKNKEIAFKPAFPASIMCTKLEWIFEPKGETTIFIAKTYYKFGKIFLTLKNGTANQIMEITKKHMDTEGQNLKKILEKND